MHLLKILTRICKMKKYLLDTHVLIWFLEGDFQLSSSAKSIILDTDNQLFTVLLHFGKWQLK